MTSINLEEYPHYMTQEESFEKLKENLFDIYKELSGGMIPNIRKVAELIVS
ncbi:MAG TPA: type II toxin-antitoxin system HicB family antitoxin [Spirochaetes bacterium]|nr:type II toxin-antitoxin system HicB family antitoxin [Spirochaetota bacterium]